MWAFDTLPLNEICGGGVFAGGLWNLPLTLQKGLKNKALFAAS